MALMQDSLPAGSLLFGLRCGRHSFEKIDFCAGRFVIAKASECACYGRELILAFLKEPFFHFALLSVAIFVWFTAQQPKEISEPDADEIVVSEQVFATLASRFRAQMQRGPTSDEAQILMDQYVRNEVLVREARALGLDSGDGVVRNRLVQKMAFLMTSAAQSTVPEDPVLQQHLIDHAEKFQTPAMVSFEQIGLKFGIQPAEIEALVVSLLNGETPPEEGLSSLLQRSVFHAGINQVDGSFGRGVFAQLEVLPLGQWAGPVTSGFGQHVVRVVEYVPPKTPDLDEVRDLVLADWRSSLANDLREAQEAALLEAYKVSRPNSETLQNWIGQ